METKNRNTHYVADIKKTPNAITLMVGKSDSVTERATTMFLIDELKNRHKKLEGVTIREGLYCDIGIKGLKAFINLTVTFEDSKERRGL